MSLSARLTARQVLSTIRDHSQQVTTTDDYCVSIRWGRTPPVGLETRVRERAAEIWCLLKQGWRTDADECPTCGCPLIVVDVDGRSYLECLQPTHYTMPIEPARRSEEIRVFV